MSRQSVPAAIVALILLSACSHSEGGSTEGKPATGLPTADLIAAVPIGHVAGVTDSAALARSIPNPYAGNPQAIAAGSALYVKLNCIGCHAAGGTGSMGPDLTDTYWRYGGLPVEVYKSIHDGRAKGMPAWGVALPPQEIWKLVAYIQSLGGTYAVYGAPRDARRPERFVPELPGDAHTKGFARKPPVAPAGPPAAAAPSLPAPAGTASP